MGLHVHIIKLVEDLKKANCWLKSKLVNIESGYSDAKMQDVTPVEDG